MKKLTFLMAFVALALLGGCSKSGGDEAEQVATKSELSIGLPIGISRTAVDAEGRASWTEGDTFALWAENATGGYIYNAVPFQMMYYWHSLQEAVFTSNANSLAEGIYTYYAVSPKPESTKGVKASYTLPTVQQGATFNGTYDVMVANPVDAPAILTDKINSLPLDFQHKMHIVKIAVAENKLGVKIGKLKFTFPSEVVGKVTVDAANASAAPTLESASRELTVDCGEGVGAGDTVWGVIFPQAIDGNINLVAEGIDGS
ncbi:MAG: fimbrillin family protein, partial [Alistipes sp.]|nr:fimbrillin family protein [Alistipes sp.]